MENNDSYDIWLALVNKWQILGIWNDNSTLSEKFLISAMLEAMFCHIQTGDNGNPLDEQTSEKFKHKFISAMKDAGIFDARILIPE